mgnify:FL=1
MKKISILLLTFMILAFVFGCAPKEKEKINISCAVSMQDAMDEIITAFTDEDTNADVTVKYASSGDIIKQIEQGDPKDVLISAGRKGMDTLKKKGCIDEESISEVAGNRLVLIVGKRREMVNFEELPKDIRYTAIGDPESVAAGRYAKEVFINLGNWDDIKERMVYGKDVKQVLKYVEDGSARAGVVYKTDAMVSDKVKISDVAPGDSYEKILYFSAIVKGSEEKKEAQAFTKFLHSSKARSIFEKYGFDM